MSFKTLFGFKEKPKQKEFIKMTKPEKKQFLSNDLIDRMIRVEQRVFASFGEHVPYYKTQYYKNLTNQEKINYKEFVKSKETKVTVAIIAAAVTLILAILLNTNLTGNVVGEYVGEQAASATSLVFAVLVILIFALIFISSFSKKRKHKRFHSHFEILDSIAKKRKIEKKELAKY